MSIHDELYEKMSGEFGSLIDGLRTAPPDTILDKAYEVSFKREILVFFELDFLDDGEARALFAQDKPLELLYQGWLHSDLSYLDILNDNVRDTVRTLPVPAERDAPEAAAEIPTVPAAKTLNSDVSTGDWVISAGNNEYAYLLGTVTAIDKPGTPEHGTENPGDDIHVDFTAFDYPPERVREIEEVFSGLYGEPKTFDELPLDDVIMAPDMLISIASLSGEEIERMGNQLENCKAFCNCFPGGSSYESYNQKHRDLLNRINENLIHYKDMLGGFGKNELVDMAGKIAAMNDTHDYLSSRGFTEDELDFLLRFRNPLEVAADGWLEYSSDLSDEMGFSLDAILRRNDYFEHEQGWLDGYPLVTDALPEDVSLRRYMDVDLELHLGKIAEKVIVHYPNDWDIDVSVLHANASSSNPEDRRFVWHVCSYGTHMCKERETFIKDTRAYNTMTNYRQNEPDMFGYIVEITGTEQGIIKGNIFEAGDYAKFAEHIRNTALPLGSVSLTYTDDWGVNAGKTITVPRKEYDRERSRLMSGSGDVKEIRCHPDESRMEMPELLRRERSARMSLPIGSTGELLQKVHERLKEARKPQEQAGRPPAAKGKQSIASLLADAAEEMKAYNTHKPHNSKTNDKEII